MLKVLIVEDEDIIRNGLVYTIDWLGMGCVVIGSAADGAEGLRMIIGKNPDLVITDIKMPRMSGIDMLAEAEKYSSFNSIILTSYSDFEFAKRAIKLRVFDYLLKPVDEEKLKEIISQVSEKAKEDAMYSEIVKITKNKTVDELESWSIYANLGASANMYVLKALDRLQSSYNQKISIELISDELGVSASYLSRKFKDVTDQTFSEILNKYRVQKALELLKAGNYRIYEISDMVGFNEYKHFCGIFKKLVGMSPTEFLKSSEKIIYKTQ